MAPLVTTAPSPYGDLADDVALLASDGKVVRRHDGLYRLNGAPEQITAAQVRGMAATVRNRRLAAKTALIHTKAGHEITKTREGTPAGDGAGTSVEGRAGSAIAKTCTKCGGPRSKWSKGLCVGCYTPAGCPPSPKPPTAEAPGKFWRAVGPVEPETGSATLVTTGNFDALSPQPIHGVSSPAPQPLSHSTADGGAGSIPADLATKLAANPLGALCGCERCVEERVSEEAARGQMGPDHAGWRYACEICGNKRCPHHTDHRLACTNSNEPGQPGSSWKISQPAPEVARPATPATDLATKLADNPLGALCGCGAQRSHTGRCWHRRGMPGPAEKRTRRTTKQCRPLGMMARILALECEVDALKSTVERMRVQMAMEQGR